MSLVTINRTQPKPVQELLADAFGTQSVDLLERSLPRDGRFRTADPDSSPKPTAISAGYSESDTSRTPICRLATAGTRDTATDESPQTTDELLDRRQ